MNRVGALLVIALVAFAAWELTAPPTVPITDASPQRWPRGTAPARLGKWKSLPLPRSPLPLSDYLTAIASPAAGSQPINLGGWAYTTLPATYRRIPGIT